MGFLQTLPHDFALALQLILPLTGCIEDFHLQVSAPCRAHYKKEISHATLIPDSAFDKSLIELQ